LSVPQGISDPYAVVAARFTTSDGRNVEVHATAPLQLDGTRRTMPSDLRFAVRASLIGRPVTPNSMVAFRRTSPSALVRPFTRSGDLGQTERLTELTAAHEDAPVAVRQPAEPIRVPVVVPGMQLPRGHSIAPMLPIVEMPVAVKPIPH
jgi:hypothetical protein